jgi:hypothetical protein
MLPLVSMRLEDIEDAVNRMSDEDMEWWPFLFLRPSEPTERMGTARVAFLAALQGVFLGMIANVLAKLSGLPINPFLFPVLVTALMFVIYRFTVAFAWNRRAARLLPVPIDSRRRRGLLPEELREDARGRGRRGAHVGEPHLAHGVEVLRVDGDRLLEIR